MKRRLFFVYHFIIYNKIERFIYSIGKTLITEHLLFERKTSFFDKKENTYMRMLLTNEQILAFPRIPVNSKSVTNFFVTH